MTTATRSTQDKFRDLLAAECEARGLELIDNPQWANTGHYIVQGSSLAPLLSIYYSWQSDPGGYWRGGGYVTFTTDRAVPGLTRADGREHRKTVHYADLDGALASILSLFALTGGKLA